MAVSPPFKSMAKPASRVLISQMPALPNVPQERRLPLGSTVQDEEKVLQSPPQLRGAHHTFPFLWICLMRSQTEIRHGTTGCKWGRQKEGGAGDNEVILKHEINQEKAVSSELNNDYMIEKKNWIVRKQWKEEVLRTKSTKAWGKPCLFISRNTKSSCCLRAAGAQ